MHTSLQALKNGLHYIDLINTIVLSFIVQIPKYLLAQPSIRIKYMHHLKGP